MDKTSIYTPALSEGEMEFTLGEVPDHEKLARASTLVERAASRFVLKIADGILESLKSLNNDVLLRWAEELPTSATALYLQSRLFSAKNHLEKSAERWLEFFNAALCHDPGLFLEAARIFARINRFGQAASLLRDALLCRPPYSFYARTEKLIAELCSQVPAARTCRIAVLSSTTTSLLVPVMRAICFRDGIASEFYEGLYGAFRQEAFDSDSKFYSFRPDIVFIATNWRDLNLPPIVDNETETVGRVTTDYKQLWNAIRSRCSCHIVQHSFDHPDEEAFDYVAGTSLGGRTRVIRLLNEDLRRQAGDGVSVLDTETVKNQVGSERWTNHALWHMARQHPAPEALPALVESQIAQVRAVMGLSRKVLITDLDNTLWGGVIGEDGVKGIELGPDSPKGEAYSRLQIYMRELRSRGVLLAVCSKNNPDDARLPFREHPHMQLRLEDFAAFEANWDDKVTNIRTIAKKLSLGLDSLVFLDDAPIERAWVHSQLPEVAVVDLGGSPFNFVRDLDRRRYFCSLGISKEDLMRSQLYQVEAERDSLRTSSQSVEEFLEKLQMRATCKPISDANLARVTQLVNKTNQFNLTSKRYTGEQIRKIGEGEGNWARAFQLSDQLGEYGVIGVMICVHGEDPRTWIIDTWLISCRALGRQMEHFIFDRMVEAARGVGLDKIVGIYRPSNKNGQVADLYSRLGFEKTSDHLSEVRYQLSLTKAKAPSCRLIAND